MSSTIEVAPAVWAWTMAVWSWSLAPAGELDEGNVGDVRAWHHAPLDQGDYDLGAGQGEVDRRRRAGSNDSDLYGCSLGATDLDAELVDGQAGGRGAVDGRDLVARLHPSRGRGRAGYHLLDGDDAIAVGDQDADAGDGCVQRILKSLVLLRREED